MSMASELELKLQRIKEQAKQEKRQKQKQIEQLRKQRRELIKIKKKIAEHKKIAEQKNRLERQKVFEREIIHKNQQRQDDFLANFDSFNGLRQTPKKTLAVIPFKERKKYKLDKFCKGSNLYLGVKYELYIKVGKMLYAITQEGI